VTPLLCVRGLGHAFGATRVLDDVDLRVAPGELVCVLGPNGAGKTTLARAISGVLRAHHGEVQLGGRPLSALSRREVARCVAVVPQEGAVPFPYSVREMVTMGRAPHLGPLGRPSEADRALVERALARLGLLELAERRFPTLSGGEKQRVMLARALVQQAPLLLLDEPTAHMDLGHRLFAFEELRAWIAEDATSRAALVVSHDLGLAGRFADRVCVLERGRVAAAGPPAQALTAELVERVYAAEARVESDDAGRVSIVALRSRIRYIPAADDPDRERPRT
jgi:iron complex transport system ATP-binding protein